MEGKRDQGNIKRGRFAWFLSLGCVLVGAISLLLAVGSLVMTVMGPLGAIVGERVAFNTPLQPKWAIEIAGSVLVTIAYASACLTLVRHADKVSERGLICALSLIALAFCAWWILDNATAYNGFSDSRQLTQYAEELARGQYSSFLPRADAYANRLPGDMYLSNYPFQSGILLTLEGFFRLFGTRAIMAFQLANAVSTIATSLVVIEMARTSGMDKPARLVVELLALTFAAPLLFCVFPYGNALGLCLCMLAMLLWMKSQRSSGGKSIAQLVSGGLLLLVGLIAKSTYILVAIGFIIVFAVDSARKSQWWRIPATIALLLLASNLAGSIPVSIMESRLGVTFPDNQPKTMWIAMGLRPDGVLGEGMPGWWSTFALDSQIRNEGDVAAQEHEAEDSIRDSLDHFAEDPAYAAWFFSKKAASEWLDPTFQSLYIASIGTMRPDAAPQGTNAPDNRYDAWDVSFAHGWICRVLLVVMDGFQTLVYAGAALGAFRLAKKSREEGQSALEYALPCAFFIGFMVYLLWEAKGMYAMPFFLCLIPLAARGIICVGEVPTGRPASIPCPSGTSWRSRGHRR